MKFRIALWAAMGLAVAFSWAVFARATFSATYGQTQGLWTFISLTCPIATLGARYPISAYESLLANAFTYAILGLVIETCRRKLPHGS